MFLTLQRILASAALLFYLAAMPTRAAAAAVDAAYEASANVSVNLRDGVTLSLDIYRPRQAGRYPTLYAAGPYPHDSDAIAPDTPATGPVAWLVGQGFNYVLASVRGTGASTGEFNFLSREEQQDHYELIEWIAAQPWSDGRVAGIGAGYYGTSQWHMAIQRPPHLDCVAPVDGMTAPYQDWANTGGLANDDFLLWYEREVRDAHAFPAAGTPRFIGLDLRLELLRHPLLDEYWFVRSALNFLDQVNIPVFALAGWNSLPSGPAQLLRAQDRLPASARFLFGTSSTQLQDSGLLERELLPFYRWCFAGQDSAAGHPAKARLRVLPGNQDTPREMQDWPAAGVRFAPLLLGRELTADGSARGRLALQAPAGAIGTSSLDDGAVVFTSAPLAQDLELAGPLLLELYASSRATDTAFTVELLEQSIELRLPGTPGPFPDFLNPALDPSLQVLTATRTRLLSTGTLKASLRNLAAPLEADMQADYAFNMPAPLLPGRVYRYDIALQPLAWRLRAGSRLVVRISQAEDASLRGLERSDTLFHNAQYGSRLQLPVWPDPVTGAEAPVFASEPVLPPDPPLTPGTTGAPTEAETLDADTLFDSDSPIILLPRQRF